MGNFTQIIEFHWEKNIGLLIKITLYAKISNIFGSKFGIYLENSSSKLNFRQIHLVYLPKPGPISKPALKSRFYGYRFSGKALFSGQNCYDGTTVFSNSGNFNIADTFGAIFAPKTAF